MDKSTLDRIEAILTSLLSEYSNNPSLPTDVDLQDYEELGKILSKLGILSGSHETYHMLELLHGCKTSIESIVKHIFYEGYKCHEKLIDCEKLEREF